MKFFLLFILFLSSTLYALEYSKIDFDGCPENSFCKKETGANRQKWLEQLKNFTKGKLSEQKLNAFVQSEFGVPVSSWAQEEASLQPNILMWDSPCKQHKVPTNKYYISEFFRKNLNANELKSIPTVYFSRAIMLDAEKNPYSFLIPRGDAPLFISDGSLYFLREEEGSFYGLLINRDGLLKITHSETSPILPKETTCTQEQIAQYVREAPGPNFYQSYYCKEIWDKTARNFKTIVLGWSCN